MTVANEGTDQLEARTRAIGELTYALRTVRDCAPFNAQDELTHALVDEILNLCPRRTS